MKYAVAFPCNESNFFMVLILGIGTLGNLPHWEEKKLQPNFLMIMSRLVIALSGSGTPYMPGNFLFRFAFMS
jgi:hypothetical protein